MAHDDDDAANYEYCFCVEDVLQTAFNMIQLL